MRKSEKEAERQESLLWLQEHGVVADAHIYCTLNHVSRSGMYRSIKLFIIRDNVPVPIWGHVARVLGLKADRDRGGVFVSGAGMDMGFHLVYELGCRMYLDGRAYPFTHEWI